MVKLWAVSVMWIVDGEIRVHDVDFVSAKTPEEAQEKCLQDRGLDGLNWVHCKAVDMCESIARSMNGMEELLFNG